MDVPMAKEVNQFSYPTREPKHFCAIESSAHKRSEYSKYGEKDSLFQRVPTSRSCLNSPWICFEWLPSN